LSNEAIRSFERTAEDEQAAATEVTPGRMTTIKVYRINDMWFAEASGFDYAGAGETPQEAIDDLLTEIGKGGFEWE
jgi:GTP-binding protein EngB required for normal cell division